MAIKVTLEDNIPWLIRVVFKSDKYGRDNCLTHNADSFKGDDPLVEFYDRRYPFDKDVDGTVLGQFVSRYYLSTLLEDGEPKHGLDLQGDVPNWKISLEGMKQVYTFLTTDYQLLRYSKK